MWTRCSECGFALKGSSVCQENWWTLAFMLMALKVFWWNDCDFRPAPSHQSINTHVCVRARMFGLKHPTLQSHRAALKAEQPCLLLLSSLLFCNPSLFPGEGSSLSAPPLKRWRTSRRTLPSAGRTPPRSTVGLFDLWLSGHPTDTAAAFAPLFRCRTLSGSPRPKSFKKIHFIKNMRQHDTRNGRYEASRSRRPSQTHGSLEVPCVTRQRPLTLSLLSLTQLIWTPDHQSDRSR